MGEDRLQRALDSIRTGDRKMARRLLTALLNENPRDIRAWLAMAMAVNDPVRRRQCYETVLEIEPQHPVARQALDPLDNVPYSSASPKKVALDQAQHLHRVPESEGSSVGRRASPPPALETSSAPPAKTVVQRQPTDSQRPLILIGGAAVLILLCFCCAFPGFIARFGAVSAEPNHTPQEQPLRAIPATYTPRPSVGGGVDTGGSGLTTGSENICARAARDYLDRINEPVYDFAELVKLRTIISTDVELAQVVVALEKPYDDFRAVTAPACTAIYARRIEGDMEQVILAMGEYAIGELNQRGADRETDSGLRQILRAYEAIVALSES